jgi:hypothetical protein
MLVPEITNINIDILQKQATLLNFWLKTKKWLSMWLEKLRVVQFFYDDCSKTDLKELCRSKSYHS